MWHFETKTHAFLIQMVRPGEYELWLNHQLVGRFSDPRTAAKNVRSGKTGDFTWDAKLAKQAPRDLMEWLLGQPEIDARE